MVTKSYAEVERRVLNWKRLHAETPTLTDTARLLEDEDDWTIEKIYWYAKAYTIAGYTFEEFHKLTAEEKDEDIRTNNNRLREWVATYFKERR